MVQSRGPLKKTVPSRPVPRDKRDGTGQEWIATWGGLADMYGAEFPLTTACITI